MKVGKNSWSAFWSKWLYFELVDFKIKLRLDEFVPLRHSRTFIHSFFSFLINILL